MSIYLPDALKERMQRAGEIGWSEIAQRAFAEALALERIEKDQDLDCVVERLRASKDRARRVGTARGVRWAREVAEYEELQAVANTRESIRKAAGSLARSYARDEIVWALCGGKNRYNKLDYETEIVPLLESAFGSENYRSHSSMPLGDFAEGFAEGAGSVLDAVASELG